MNAGQDFRLGGMGRSVRGSTGCHEALGRDIAATAGVLLVDL